MAIFAGIDGGGSNSQLVLLNEKGEIVLREEWGGTNAYLIGLEKAAHEIGQLVTNAKSAIGMSDTTQIETLGMALSGAEDPDQNDQLINMVKKFYPHLTRQMYLTTDSIGTIATSLKDGGIVLIAGTGSSCRLMTTNGRVDGCGGWGHAIGDQGGGYWISNRAIRYIFDEDDCLFRSPSDTSVIRELIHKYFSVENKVQLLDYFYSKFNKAHIAGLCKLLAENAKNDPLCQLIFKEAGRFLGLHVLAVCSKADSWMLEDLPVVMVGSVFKSWNLLEEGFLEGLKRRDKDDAVIKAIRLFQLTESPSVGAALLAAKKLQKIVIPFDFTKTAKLFYQKVLAL